VPSIAGRLLSILSGLFCFALGIVVCIRSEVGLGPWDALHQGLTHQFPMRFGEANILVGVLVLAIAWRAGQRPGVGTILNMFLVGFFIDRILDLGLVPEFAALSYPVRTVTNLAGIFAIGFGSALYIRARLGAGPRDSLMLAISERTGWPVGVARSGLELLVLIAGIALGGQWGLGTLLFALAIGPSVEVGFHVLRVPRDARLRPPDAPPAGTAP
jgi:uncharacterized membrane protein YczE